MTPTTAAPQRRLYLPAGTAPGGPFVTELTPQACGWAYSSLRVLELGPGGEATFRTGPDEMLVLPLSGGAAVAVDGAEFTLAGRADVFSRVTDFAYLPIDAAVTVRSAAGGRLRAAGRAGRAPAAAAVRARGAGAR